MKKIFEFEVGGENQKFNFGDECWNLLQRKTGARTGAELMHILRNYPNETVAIDKIYFFIESIN